MAEGVSGRNVYFTRSRKRSSEQAPDPRTLEPLEKETPGQRTVETSLEAEEDIIDLTHDEECETDSPAKGSKSSKSGYECAICLQTCVHPARLPCGHIFCFLCVKGAAHGNRKCAMCRSPIPHNYFNNPDLVETPEELTASDQEGYEWFYEGRNGWWQYDPRASRDIESAWQNGVMECELLIAGYLYIIDFRDMCQLRKGQPSRMRRIKRDLACVEKLGVAGLRDPNAAPPRRHSEGDKGRNDEDDEEYDTTDEPPRRSSLTSTGYIFNVYESIEDQMADLSLNSDDDDSYQ